MEIFNELVLFLFMIILISFLFDYDQGVKLAVGWVAIGVVTINFMVLWIIIYYEYILIIKDKLKKKMEAKRSVAIIPN